MGLQMEQAALAVILFFQLSQQRGAVVVEVMPRQAQRSEQTAGRAVAVAQMIALAQLEAQGTLQAQAQVKGQTAAQVIIQTAMLAAAVVVLRRPVLLVQTMQAAAKAAMEVHQVLLEVQ